MLYPLSYGRNFNWNFLVYRYFLRLAYGTVAISRVVAFDIVCHRIATYSIEPHLLL